MLKAVSRFAETPTKGHRPKNMASTKLLIRNALRKIKLNDSGFMAFLFNQMVLG
jgi:hypothetical protein